MELEEAIRSRRSIKTYDPDTPVDDDTLRRLFELVVLSPSSYNLQHWRFVVVRDPERRAQLKDAAWGQPHVGTAPCTIVVAGKLPAHRDADRANAHAPETVRSKLVPMIEKAYASQPQLQRDEAIRSASIASMTLMLVARELGLVTCPMIGFDPEAVARIAGLDDDHVPVMMVTLGRRGGGEVLPTSRFPVEEVVRRETLDGPPL